MIDNAPPSVRDVTRDLLRQLGMTTVFGNPGTTEVPFLTQWPDDFRYVLGLQESVVVGMADGYAQGTGRPVLVNLHSAGGVGHGLGALFTAYRNRTPMVVLAGQQVRSLMPQDPYLGATEAVTFPQPYVKWAIEPARAADVPAAIARAHQIATQHPYGPTFVSVPADDWDEPGVPHPALRRIPGHAPDPEALDELVTALRDCERPAFVAGPAVVEDGAVDDLVALAERSGAAVWVPPLSSRSAFPERHPQFQGFLQPERCALADALDPYDLVVVFGAPAFTYHVYRGEASVKLPSTYLVSDDPQVLARMPEGQGISASLGLALRQLRDRVPESSRSFPPKRVRPELPPVQGTVAAAHVLDVLDSELPDNAVVVEEAPTHRGDVQALLNIDVPGQEFHTMASGALGFGLPAAVGAALAEPQRPVVAVVGDGSSMYGIQALWTAARECASMTVLVLDNSEYAAVRLLGGADENNKLPGVDLGGIDFVSLAESLGCAARRVDDLDTLRSALVESFATPGAVVLHVPVAQSTQRPY
jgi:benzoylformate decarboxylase